MCDKKSVVNSNGVKEVVQSCKVRKSCQLKCSAVSAAPPCRDQRALLLSLPSRCEAMRHGHRSRRRVRSVSRSSHVPTLPFHCCSSFFSLSLSLSWGTRFAVATHTSLACDHCSLARGHGQRGLSEGCARRARAISRGRFARVASGKVAISTAEKEE